MSTSGRFRFWHLALITAMAVVLSVCLFPVFGDGGGRNAAIRAACLSNLKQLAIGMLLYASDHDDRLPFRDAWMDAAYGARDSIHPVEGGRMIEHCQRLWVNTGKDPNLFGYAFNSRLSHTVTEGIEQQGEMPMVYDSINMGRNASDPFSSLPVPGRHEGKNNLGYLDGHAKSLPWPSRKEP